MSRAAWAVAAAAGVTLAAGVGCYSPPQYAPQYGYPAAPAYPAAPPGGYVMPGNAAPGMLGPATTVPGSGPTLAPPLNSSDAPPYNGTFDNSASPAGPAVPNYADPQPGDIENDGSFGGDPGAGQPEDGFVPPATNDGANGTPFMEGAALPRPLPTAQAAPPAAKPDFFAGIDRYQRSNRPVDPIDLAAADAEPSGVRPAAFEERPAVSEDSGFDPAHAPAADEADESGFGYEPAGYHWLRGVVDYDPASRSWNIIYALDPDPADRYAGSLTLADNGHLAQFQSNDVVLVEGRPDPQSGRDLLHKPLYRVTNAELIGRFE